jgi:twitching motility protein PilT
VNLDEMLVEMVEREGSDLHVKTGRPPLVRISGDLLPTEHDPLSDKDVREALTEIMPGESRKAFEELKDADFSYEIADVGRFRVNAFIQRGKAGAVFRYIPMKIPTIDEMQLPAVLKDVAGAKQGLVLVTGPTGSGKSTTLAAIINHINETRPAHIMTIEDPVEFVYEDKKATINQREVGRDTSDFKTALRAALRQDPDIILMGEMRDQESIEIAMHAAETGHLVFSTLHTNDSGQTIDRVMNTFPPDAQTHIREMLALVLNGIIAQRLVLRADGTGRIAAVEVMINSPAISELIESGAVSDIDSAIAKSGAYYRMQTMNQALMHLVKGDLITEEAAYATSMNPDDLKLLIKGFSRGGTTAVSREMRAKEDAHEADVAAARGALEEQDEAKSGEEQGEEALGDQDAEKKPKLKITRGFNY